MAKGLAAFLILASFAGRGMAMKLNHESAAVGNSTMKLQQEAALGEQLDIGAQPRESVQVVNPSSTEHLHVFFQLNPTTKRPWIKLGGSGAIYSAVGWGFWSNTSAWPPLGQKFAQEAIIPPGGYIVLQMPVNDPPQFVLMAIKMTDPSRSTPVPATTATSFVNGVPPPIVGEQQAVVIEAGRDAIADSSAVDGVNYHVKYELTTGTTEVKSTELLPDPCGVLGSQYDAGPGCKSFPKVDCGPSETTCDCQPGTQICKFNNCSQTLFSIPPELQQFITEWDTSGTKVKPFINDPSNLKEAYMRDYCARVNGNGDFNTYCYDYNDVGSSPTLRDPYKIKVTYSDLVTGLTLPAPSTGTPLVPFSPAMLAVSAAILAAVLAAVISCSQ